MQVVYNSAMVCISYGKTTICEKDKVRVMIGIRIFIGEIEEIDEYNNIILRDVKQNVIIFKPRNVKFIQKISEEEFVRIKMRYDQEKK